MPHTTHETAPVRRRALWAAAIVVVLLGFGWPLLAWVTIPGPGLERAAEDADFRACAEDAGAEIDDAGDLSAEQEAQRWTSPGLLACAEATFDDDELAAVTERLFQPKRTRVLAGFLGEGPACDIAQEPALQQLGSDVAEAAGERAGVDAAVRVLLARPDDETRSPVDLAATFGLLEATGTLPGYADFLERNTESNYDRDDLDVVYLVDLSDDLPREFMDRRDSIREPLLDAARSRETPRRGC